jgi:hypothetical protein
LNSPCYGEESSLLNEAELARLKLQSEGIHCTPSGQAISTMHPLIFHSVELLVNPQDLPRARDRGVDVSLFCRVRS